jgi:hypothetical protein
MKWKPSEEQIDLYAYGRCMYLASAFAARMSGEIETVIDAGNYIGHAWFVDERGYAWDIDGKRPAPAVRNEHRWGERIFRRFDSEQMWRFIGSTPNAAAKAEAEALAADIIKTERK